MSNILFVRSQDTSILEHLIRSAEEGDVVTYAEMSKAIGRDVRVHAKGCLNSARNILSRDGVHTDAVVNVGIKRLLPDECVGKARAHVRKSRRAAGRGRQTIETTDFEKLEPEKKTEALAIAAQAGAIELFGSKKAHNRLCEKATTGAIPLGRTISLFVEK